MRLVEALDELLYDAPLDFWGTGGCGEATAAEESWTTEVEALRHRLRLADVEIDHLREINAELLAALKAIVGADTMTVSVGYDDSAGGGAVKYTEAVRTDSEEFTKARAGSPGSAANRLVCGTRWRCPASRCCARTSPRRNRQSHQVTPTPPAGLNQSPAALSYRQT